MTHCLWNVYWVHIVSPSEIYPCFLTGLLQTFCRNLSVVTWPIVVLNVIFIKWSCDHSTPCPFHQWFPRAPKYWFLIRLNIVPQGLGRWHGQLSACCASMRTWVWFPSTRIKGRTECCRPVLPMLREDSRDRLTDQTVLSNWQVPDSGRYPVSKNNVDSSWGRYQKSASVLHILHVHMTVYSQTCKHTKETKKKLKIVL